MSPPPPSSTIPPPLTPQFCYTPLALRSFLRTSRSLTDDPITQHLSALSTPSSTPFHPHTSLPPTRQPSTNRIPASTCASFLSSTLFPAWAARDEVLAYCDRVAGQEDGDDPERVEREVKRRRAEEKVVDERTDPYSGRERAGVGLGESRRERLAREVREEKEVEGIVRGRSWGVVRGRCEGVDGDWRGVEGKWEEGGKGGRR